MPRIPPSHSPEAYRELEKELSDLLLRAQGRGKVCTVKLLHLRGTDYFFGHPDDFVQNVTAHDDDGRLAPRAYRRTFAIVFAFNAEEGTLELFARVPAKLKPRIEEVFARTMLGVELDVWNPDSYDLDRLKRRSFALTTDPEDCVRARVRRLRLSFKNSHRRLLLEADPDGPASDIYDKIDEVLNEERVPLSSVHVTLATFGFEILPLDGRKPGSMSFDVAFPNTCSLRNQRPERIELALKYLKRWKIDVPNSRIWQRLDSEPPLFFADEVGRHFGDGLARLIEFSLLSETTPSSCVPCWDCGRGFVGRVEFLLHRRTSTRRPYIHCPECGVKELNGRMY